MGDGGISRLTHSSARGTDYQRELFLFSFFEITVVQIKASLAN